MKSGLPSTLPLTKTERVLFLIIAKPFFLGLHACTLTAATLSQCVKVEFVEELFCLAETLQGCSLAFRRGRKHSLPMGTASTGPESLKISVAIGLPSFLPSCPVTNTLQAR